MTPHWLSNPVHPISPLAAERATMRQSQLTKPPGSLGRLEELAIRFCAMQHNDRPSVDRVKIVIFAADHGIAKENVSAFPQAVTAEMVRNFARQGAAICVLARQADAQLEVVNLGTVSELETLPGVINHPIAAGSANFTKQPAMTHPQLEQALWQGREAVTRARNENIELLIAGEMGIANTTSATAIACRLLGQAAEQLVGPGTGLSAEGVSHKAAVINAALQLHQLNSRDALEILRTLGGFEIAALTGCYIAAAQQGLPMLVDGFITSVAALVAVKLQPDVGHWLIHSHRSQEPGHQAVIEALKARPLLDLNMRLGEGSGAATALPLLRLACSLHNQMATFEQAAVSEKH